MCFPHGSRKRLMYTSSQAKDSARASAARNSQGSDTITEHHTLGSNCSSYRGVQGHKWMAKMIALSQLRRA
ncbi:hypothetical protein HBI56_107670 [Parastagonospora nodorum]|nr:hypothetical protein HBH53_086160 [Parastagonospora nodorum]KAH3974547.1 hypothetical protein HBH52_135400 [Parastagonospora nodorum]KAH3977732.1 hypothetical protein HBH51_069700 [Parastagonospora nodorum]KAH3995864.1 hypothetical protein HBI10_166510 [Parastagonospora nodorum]KAH4021813.1 hypothetical protein HBI13_107760 [Parastagonospora nodorum]